MQRRVLVVDDDPDIRTLLHLILGQSGIEVFLAGDGADCLAQAALHRPDALLLDANLPDMSGWDVLDTMTADPELAKIPVIILSGDGTTEGLGAPALRLTKPVSTAQLLDAVMAVLGPDGHD